MEKKSNPLRQRVAGLSREIRGMDLFSSGTLLERRMVCGKKQCRCRRDEEARHGPYWEWTWWENGRLRHRLLSPKQAEQMSRAISNRKKVLALLAQWEQESRAQIMP